MSKMPLMGIGIPMAGERNGFPRIASAANAANKPKPKPKSEYATLRQRGRARRNEQLLTLRLERPTLVFADLLPAKA